MNWKIGYIPTNAYYSEVFSGAADVLMIEDPARREAKMCNDLDVDLV